MFVFYRYLEVLAEFDLESLQNEQERMAFLDQRL